MDQTLHNFNKLRVSEHFWKMRPAKCAQDCSESLISHRKRKKKTGVRSSAGFVRSKSQCQRCANVDRFGATLLLCGLATGCDKTHWHGCAQQSMSDAATLLASGVAAGGC